MAVQGQHTRTLPCGGGTREQQVDRQWWVALRGQHQFVAAVVRDVNNLKMGAGDGYDFGSLIDENQVAVTERHVADAKAKGAKVLTGGQRLERQGYFYEPTILTHVTREMTVFRQETFGPVAACEALAMSPAGAGPCFSSPNPAAVLIPGTRSCAQRCIGNSRQKPTAVVSNDRAPSTVTFASDNSSSVCRL